MTKDTAMSTIGNYTTPTHYSKSQIFVQKFNFDKTPTFSRVFHPNFFWQFLSWNQSCQQLKSPKPQHFREFFTPKNRQFLRKIKVEFLDKKWRFRTVCPRYQIAMAPRLFIFLSLQLQVDRSWGRRSFTDLWPLPARRLSCLRRTMEFPRCHCLW